MIFPGEQVEGEFKPISIGRALDPVMRRVIRYRETANQLMGLCESPIEEALGVAILDLFGWRGNGYIQVCRDPKDASSPLALIPQYSWSFYRSDFALFGCDLPNPFLIECDGKDFHSSEKQREHDLRKDLAAADRDLQTFRFSGQQIHKDAIACAEEIASHCPHLRRSKEDGRLEMLHAWRALADEFHSILRNYGFAASTKWRSSHPEFDALFSKIWIEGN